MRLQHIFLLGALLSISLAITATAGTMESSMGLSEITGGVEKTSAGHPSQVLYVASDFSEMAALPGFTILAPSGLVPGFGGVFAGVGGITNSDDTDGAVAVGAGFGDPTKLVGGAASLGIGSIDPRDGGAMNRGSLNISLGHTFTEYGIGAAVGATNIDLWHAGSDERTDPSLYAAVTKLLPNDLAPVILTVGLGNRSFVDIGRGIAWDDKKDEIDVFAAAAVYVLPQVSLIADYTAGVTTMGTSIVPFPKYPIVLGLAANDVFTETPGDKVSFLGTLAAGYAFK
jgi:hypothetical protein